MRATAIFSPRLVWILFAKVPSFLPAGFRCGREKEKKKRHAFPWQCLHNCRQRFLLMQIALLHRFMFSAEVAKVLTLCAWVERTDMKTGKSQCADSTPDTEIKVKKFRFWNVVLAFTLSGTAVTRLDTLYHVIRLQIIVYYSIRPLQTYQDPAVPPNFQPIHQRCCPRSLWMHRRAKVGESVHRKTISHSLHKSGLVGRMARRKTWHWDWGRNSQRSCF